jgi:hypothetical protein
MKSLASSTVLFSLLFCASLAHAQTTPVPAPAAAPAGPTNYDFGDFKSVTLTSKAWKALTDKDYPGVAAYTGKCIDTYKDQAIQMQGSLKAPAAKDDANNYWALNDVGTCYFIAGQALDAKGDKKGAIAAYKFLVDKLSFAQCWDPQGWFWSPADAAKKRLAELQFDSAQ